MDVRYPPPPVRRGHTMVIRNPYGGDAQALVYGGHYDDVPMRDMWYMFMQRDRKERIWTRIDQASVHPFFSQLYNEYHPVTLFFYVGWYQATHQSVPSNARI